MDKFKKEKKFQEHDEVKKRARFIKSRDEKRRLTNEEDEHDEKYYNYEWKIK